MFYLRVAFHERKYFKVSQKLTQPGNSAQSLTGDTLQVSALPTRLQHSDLAEQPCEGPPECQDEL